MLMFLLTPWPKTSRTVPNPFKRKPSKTPQLFTPELSAFLEWLRL